MTAPRFPEPSLTVAETLARSASLNRLLSKPISGVLKMPIALTMREKIQKIRATHAQSLAALDAKVDVELKAVAEEAARTVNDLDVKLQGDINEHKAEIAALRDELNQMTNGGPPLSDSENSREQSDEHGQG